MTIKDQDDDGSLTATGGFGSAGIGGSCYGSSSDIKISGNAVVAVAGGTYEQAFGNAYPDVTELSCPGHIEYYASGTTAEQIQKQQVQPTDKCYASQGHTSGTPQKENEIAGDCTTDHEYDLVTYCTVCGAKLSTDHVNTGNVHTPGEAVKENEVAATDFTEGSYDSVVYCSVCYEELSRKAVTVPALLDPFTQFCLTLTRRIRTAPENGTVEADAGLWPGLQRVVFEALADRPDVTLKIVCRLDGAATELTLPAGMDLLEKIGDARMTTFADLAKLLA